MMNGVQEEKKSGGEQDDDLDYSADILTRSHKHHHHHNNSSSFLADSSYTASPATTSSKDRKKKRKKKKKSSRKKQELADASSSSALSASMTTTTMTMESSNGTLQSSISSAVSDTGAAVATHQVPPPFSASLGSISEEGQAYKSVAQGQQHGKTKSKTAAVLPGAVSVHNSATAAAGGETAREPPSFRSPSSSLKNASISGMSPTQQQRGPPTTSYYGQHGKSKRATAALVPGAVSVKASSSDFDNEAVTAEPLFQGSSTVMHHESKPLSSSSSRHHEKSKHTMVALVPLAVPMKGDEQPGQPLRSSRIAMGDTTGTRSTSRQHGKSKRTTAALVPGAVPMKGDEPEPLLSSASTPASSDTLRSTSRQHGKSKRTMAALVPGAVPMKGDEPEPMGDSMRPNHSSRQHGKSKQKLVPGAVPMKRVEPEPILHASSTSMGDTMRPNRSSRQHGKSKRTTAALTPGAVPMKGDEPEPLHASGTSMNESSKPRSSRQHGKSKRATAALVPGAVPIKHGGDEPKSLHESSTFMDDNKHSIPRQHGKAKRTTAALVPGAVSMKDNDDVVVLEPLHASVGSIDEPASSTRRHRKSKRTVAALVPGAVPSQSDAVETFHSSSNSVHMSASSGSMGGEMSTSSQFGKWKRSTAASIPGAVSSMAGEEPDSFHMSGSAAYDGERSSFSVSHKPMENSERSSSKSNRDREQKRRGKSKRKTVALTAGAVAVNTDDETTSFSNERNRTLMSSQDIDARATYGGRSSREVAGTQVEAMSIPGAQDLSGQEAQTADELRRRKDPRTSAQERSFRSRNAEAVATVGAAGVAAVSAEYDTEESNEDYRNRMDAKIEQMEMEMNTAASNAALAAEKRGANAASDLEQNSEDRFDIEKDEPVAEQDTRPPRTESVLAQGLTHPPDVEYGQLPDGEMGLAVAMAVDEEDDPMLPAAIEYDPYAKPPIYRNRRFRLYAIAGAVLLIAVIVGVVVGVVTNKDDSASVPTAPPTTLLEAAYRDQFVEVVGDQVNVADSPHDRAANWMMFEDPLALPPDAPNLIQRYQLSLFYFLTTDNRQRPWKSCNPPLENETDSCVFQDIQFGEDGKYYEEVLFQTRWMAGTHECEWIGTFCDLNQNLIALEMAGQGMVGELPTEISTLPYLQAITLHWNEFSGTLPEVYAKEMSNRLVSLELHFNFLTGTVPDAYWNASALQLLNLGGNMLTGTISNDVGKLNQMKGLFLFENKLTGSIPTDLGNLSFLSYMRLHGNGLAGGLPTEVGRMTLLRELWLWENSLQGKLPSELGLMRDLEILELHENQFTGSIPEEIYSLTQLFSFDVNSCRLTGTLSTMIGQLTNMDLFRVSKNALTGTIPDQAANLSLARLFWFHQTSFTGTVPEALCQFRPDPLVILQADCLPPDNPPVSCLCCSHCCNRDDGICLSQT